MSEGLVSKERQNSTESIVLSNKSNQRKEHLPRFNTPKKDN